MPRLIGERLPKYRKHRASGQAVVTLDGRDFYLGPWQSKTSKGEYDRLVAEWLANGRKAPGSTDLTINEVASRYFNFAEGYYVKNGVPTGTIDGIKVGLRFLCSGNGRTLAREFGPLSLAALQLKMVEAGQARTYVNDNIDRIRRCIKWAVSQELIPAAVHQALTTVPGLRKGRTTAREPAPILPVPENVFQATLPFLRPVVADMVRLQRLTGCRPEEVCMLRPCDVDRSGDVWAYRPASHKNEHLDRARVIFLGPRAQSILLPYLLREADAYCFSPAESEATHNAERRAARQSPMTPSQAARMPKRTPVRKPGSRYTADSYRRAIHRACDLADRHGHGEHPQVPADERIIPRWSPNRLRHSAATEIRARFGLEAAATVLGHAKADVTQIYAERDMAKAAQIMGEVG